MIGSVLVLVLPVAFHSQCCFPSTSFNTPLSTGYSTMSFTYISLRLLLYFIVSFVSDPETGRVYQKIDDGSGTPRWIEENNMCQNKYIDGLGYVSVPSSCLSLIHNNLIHIDISLEAW